MPRPSSWRFPSFEDRAQLGILAALSPAFAVVAVVLLV